MDISIEQSMLTLTIDDEIDQYLRDMFWKECRCKVKYKQPHKTLFSKIREIVGIRRPEDIWFERSSQRISAPMARKVQLRWLRRLNELEKDSIIMREDYEVKNCATILTWSGHYTYSCNRYNKEIISIKDNDDISITTLIHEEIDTLDNSIIMRKVKIKEYEDRYEEEITKDHPDYDKYPETIHRLIRKRDLFREEFHMNPYRPIHLELLYSLDLPVWFENEARRAQRHFKSLV